MSAHEPKFKDLDHTVVPAQPGFRVATFYCGEDNKPTNDTETSDLGVTFFPVIAWIIRPCLKIRPSSEEISHASVVMITPEGVREADTDYLVDPHGVWSLPYVATFDSEQSARAHWIKTKLRSA